MGRSIPSFRQLIEIERMNWTGFKKSLSNKKDKEAFDSIFENARLYTQYLSNANIPVPFEPIIMGALFHNYKSVLKSSKEGIETEDIFSQKLSKMERQKPMTKMLFDKTCERWNGLIYSIHKEDSEPLLRMLVNCCESLNESTAKTIIDADSESSVAFLYLLYLLMQHQKLLNGMEKAIEKNAKKELTLLDFMS